jgi:hypothetical protein
LFAAIAERTPTRASWAVKARRQRTLLSSFRLWFPAALRIFHGEKGRLNIERRA